MKNVKRLLVNPFSILLYLGEIAGIFPLFMYEKGEIVLWINQRFAENNYDLFYTRFTELGSGMSFVVLALLYLLFNTRKAYQVVITSILVLVVSQGLKHAFGYPRPTAYIPKDAFCHLIEGFEYAKNFSFPSGHTMAAFAVFTLIAHYTYSISIKVLGFFTAATIGFSRMYLLQHFYMDVYVGAFLGFGCALLAIAFFSDAKYIPLRGLFRRKEIA